MPNATPRRLCLPLSRLLALCVVWTTCATGCVIGRAERSLTQVEMERRQWGMVQSEAPLVGEALLLSILALEETDPLSAAQARQEAVDLARRAGVVTTPRLVCNACELETNGDRMNHMQCLQKRLNCLYPR